MFKKPDYSTYSYAQLVDVAANIDKVQYEDRYQEVIARIRELQESGDASESAEDDVDSELSSRMDAAMRLPTKLTVVGAVLMTTGVLVVSENAEHAVKVTDPFWRYGGGSFLMACGLYLGVRAWKSLIESGSTERVVENDE